MNNSNNNAHVFRFDPVAHTYEHKVVCRAEFELSILSDHKRIVEAVKAQVGDVLLIDGQFLELTAMAPCSFRVLHPRRPELKGLSQQAQQAEFAA